MNKIEEIAAMLKQYDIKDLKNVRALNDLKDFLAHKEEEKKKGKNVLLCIFAVVGVIVVVAAICYGVYRYLVPDYLEDFDDDFDDEFDDDFFDDEDEDKEDKEEQPAKDWKDDVEKEDLAASEE